MSSENEQLAYPWDDDENDYPEATNPRAAQTNSDYPTRNPARRSQEPVRRSRPRGVPGSADFYEVNESDEQSTRPRRVRQSREEVEARLRQRNRQPIYGQEQRAYRARPTSQERPSTPRPAQRDLRETDYNYQEELRRLSRPTRDFAPGAAPRPTRAFASEYPTQPAPEPYDASNRPDEPVYVEGEERRYGPEHRRHHRRERRRRVYSTIFTGCIGGLITLLVVAAVLFFLVLHNTPLGQKIGVSKATVNQAPQTQTLTLANATQLIVKDPVGNISVSVDQSATIATLTSVRHVQASSQSDANAQFKQILLSVKPIARGDDPACLATACLLINATVPTTTGDGGLLGGGNSDSIDLTVSLPPSFNSSDPSAPNIITANADAGNINVSSFNGVLNLNGNAGNISVAHTLIFASTCIQTLHGNVTIAQQSIFDLSAASSIVPCSNASSNDPTRPWFNVKSGVGNLDLTLTTNLSNLLLDANTNDGTITDDFNLALTSSDNSYSYHGPLVPNTNPNASLYIATSTGNIILRKA